jgi:streptogrisin C
VLSSDPLSRGGPSVGAWRSLVARIVRDDEVGGSNPLAPTRPTFFHVQKVGPGACARCLGPRRLTVRLHAQDARPQKAIETVHYAVFEAANVRDVTTSFDFDTREITTVAALETGVADAALDELRADATDRLVDAGLGRLLDSIAVRVVRSNLPALGGSDDNNAHIGGEGITGCTTGFVVKNAAGVRGVGTAGHCQNAQSDDGQALAFQAGHEGAQGDFQWHTGPQAEPDDFYSGDADTTEVARRDVAGVGAPVVNQSLCKNGKNGFKDCGTVIQLNVCHFDLCNLVQMDARRATGGDSGGPVYWNNTAYGFHQGWRYDPVWPFDRDLFSRADRIDNALGVNVANS